MGDLPSQEMPVSISAGHFSGNPEIGWNTVFSPKESPSELLVELFVEGFAEEVLTVVMEDVCSCTCEVRGVFSVDEEVVSVMLDGLDSSFSWMIIVDSVKE